MGKINRFYQPSQNAYISQFVPKQLPVDLMIAPLEAKQGVYNVQQEKLDLLGRWDARALPGYDTDYKEGKREQIKSFINASTERDLASPEFIREYKGFIRDFQDDKGLKSVGKSVAIHDEYLERQKKLKEGKGTDYDRAFVDQYIRRYSQYTEKGGKGFTGDPLGDPSILEGTDINAEFEEYFNQLKADGYEEVMKLSELTNDGRYGLTYKNGWKGVSGNKVSDHASGIFDLAYESRAGQQLQARYKASNIPAGQTYEQYLGSLPPKERVDFEGAMRTDVAHKLLNVGKGFVWNQTTTNADAAINKRAGWDREEKKAIVQDVPLNVNSTTQIWDMKGLEDAMKDYENNDKSIANSETTIDAYNKMLITAETGEGEAFTPEERELMKGLPGYAKLANGQQLTEGEKESLSLAIGTRIKDHQRNIDYAQTENDVQEERMRDAIAETLKYPKYGDDKLSFQEAINVGKLLEEDPVLGEHVESISADITEMLKEGNPDEVKEEIEQMLVLAKTDIYNNIEDGTFTAQEGANALDKFKDLETWAEAEVDLTATIATKDAPAAKRLTMGAGFQAGMTAGPIGGAMGVVASLFSEEEVKTGNSLRENFDKSRSYSPKSVVLPTSKTVILNTVNSQGGLSKIKTQRVDAKIQDLVNTGLDTNFEVYLGNELITPSDERYPTASTIKLSSLVLEYRTHDPAPLFSGRGTATIAATDLSASPDKVDKGDVLKNAKKEFNYTFKAVGPDASQYFTHKANEELSNYYAEPNTFSGTGSYLNYVSLADRELGTGITKANALNNGETTLFNREIPIRKNGGVETIRTRITKSENGGFLLSMKSISDGTNIFNTEEELRRFSTIQELGGFIMQVEEGYFKQADNGYLPTR